MQMLLLATTLQGMLGNVKALVIACLGTVLLIILAVAFVRSMHARHYGMMAVDLLAACAVAVILWGNMPSLLHSVAHTIGG